MTAGSVLRPPYRAVPMLAVALALVQAAGFLHARWTRTSWPSRSAAWTQARVARLHERQAELTTAVAAAARSVAVAPASAAGLTGDRSARAELFTLLARHHDESRGRFPEPIALGVHTPDGRPIAWAGRVGTSPAGREAAVELRSGRIATALLATAPIRAADGTITGFASAELPIAVRRHIRNTFLFDFDLLAAGDPEVHLTYDGERPAAAASRIDAQGVLRGPDEKLWATYRVTAPSAETALRRVRRAYDSASVALGSLLLGAALLATRRHRPLSSGDVLAAATLWRLLLWAVPVLPSRLTTDLFYASAAAETLPGGLGRLVGSPLDLVLTAAWAALAAAWLLRKSVDRRGLLPPAGGIAADVVSLLVLALVFSWIADVVFESSLELDVVSLVPRHSALLALQAGALCVIAGGAMLTAAIQCALTRAPQTPLGRALRLGGAAVVGMIAFEFWPRAVIGLPLFPVAVLFVLGVAAGVWREQWTAAWRAASAGVRAAWLAAAVIGAQVVLHPSLVHYGEKNRRQQIENDYAPLVLQQPQWREQLLTSALERIDSLQVLSARPPGADAASLSELAFAVWSETDLATHGFASAVEIQDAAGTVVSRFALNLASVSAGPLPLPGAARWDVRWDTLQLVSARRPVRHARRLLVYDGRVRGAVHVYVGDDLWNLGFLEGRDPYPTLFRTAAARSRRDRPVHLVAYDENHAVIFNSTDRPPGLTAELVRELRAHPRGVWTTVSFGPVRHHAYFFSDEGRTYALSFPKIGPARYASNLVESAAGAALAFATVLMLVLAVRSALRYDTFTLHTMVATWLGRFSLRLFVAFVALAVVSVGVLQLVTRSYLIERLRVSTERQGLQRAETAQKAVEDFAYFQQTERDAEAPVTDAALVWVASLIRNDVDLFEGGQIAASSKRELYASRLLGARVSGPVYQALVLNGQPSAIRTERIGGFSYLVASVPVRLGQDEPAILSIPLALRQREVQSIVDDLDRTIRLASLLFLAGAALLAHRMARRISDPLRALTAATERIASGDLEARVTVRSRDELRQLVESFNRMAADLDRQRRDLERSNRLAAWAEMARQVAHEVKNPLTPIQLSTQHLRRVFGDPSVDFRAALETCTSTILEQVRKLREIATEFSSFARPPAADRTAAPLGDVVRRTLAPYSAGLPAGVQLEVHAAADGPAARVDERLLGRAIVNLVENALQAVGESGRIDVTVRRNGRRAEIAVADTGPGIEPALRERVFEPFFSTKSTGSGIGLALVKKIVEDHGGGVELSSEPGRGTTILLWLWTDDEQQATPPVQAQASG